MTALLPEKGQGKEQGSSMKVATHAVLQAISNVMKAFGAPSATTDAKIIIKRWYSISQKKHFGGLVSIR